MIGNHIPFEKISSFYDEELAQDEMAELLEHIERCSFCKGEYDQLTEMLGYCSVLKETLVCRDDFVKKTMGVIKWRMRRRALAPRLPLVAASVVIVGGALMFVSIFNQPAKMELIKNITTNQKPFYSMPAVNDAESVISILSSNNVSILKVSDIFIEGEIPAVYFPRLRRELGFRKVFYKIGERSDLRPSKPDSYIETVGAGNHGNINLSYKLDRDEYVRFRVFK